MIRLSNPLAIVLLFILSMASLLLAAEEHTDAALEHASAAARARDSRSVAEHAAEALRHTEAAKSNAADEEARMHLEKGEDTLNSAVQNANWHNTHSAVDDARDSRKHLEEAAKR